VGSCCVFLSSNVDTVNIDHHVDNVNIVCETFFMSSQQPGPGEHAYHHGDLRRSLIDAAMALVREEQDWTFSLREVARRAGVSHNAPYNHFRDKRDLLAAVAVAGFAALRDRMAAAVEGIEGAEAALVKSASVYVKFGVENPAHYRLMFSSALATPAEGRPEPVADAGAETKALLEQILRRGARAGVFTASLNRREELQVAVLSAWSAVHGLTMLAIDGLTGAPGLPVERIAEKLARTFCGGLRR